MEFNPENNLMESKPEKGELEEALEKYLFHSEENKFGEKKKKRLAKKEKYYYSKKEHSNWPEEYEIERCNLRKQLEEVLVQKKTEEIEKYWKNNKEEFYNYYGRSGNNEEKNKLFESLKHGILNEIIARWALDKELNKFGDFQIKITTSKVDVKDKIDVICFSEKDKTVLAVQVKNGSRKSEDVKENGVIQEISGESGEIKEMDKREFSEGCSRLEKELDYEGIQTEMKKIWLVIPSEDKVGEGGEYKYRLEEDIKNGLKEMLE